MDESPKRGLLAAYGRLLGPLVRILIRNGVTFGEFAEVAKQTYVAVAAKDFAVTNKEITQTRISALTGLQQGEVKRVRQLDGEAQRRKNSSFLNQIAGILFGWHTDSDFTGPYGVPLELRLDASNQVDFRELSRRHVGDFSPETLLAELLKIGAVVETEKNWFKVLTRNFIPEPAAPEGLDHLAISVQEFVSTLDHNRTKTKPSEKLFERQVYTEEGIRAEDLPRFTEFANHKAQLLLEEIDNWLSQLDKPDVTTTNKLSTGLGIYHYIHSDDQVKRD